MKRSNWPALDARNKDSVGVVLMLLDKVARGLLGRNGDKWYSLVRWLEPNNLWLVLVALGLLTAMSTIFRLAFSILLLFGCLTAGTQKTQSARKHLASNPLDDCHDVPG